MFTHIVFVLSIVWRSETIKCDKHTKIQEIRKFHLQYFSWHCCSFDIFECGTKYFIKVFVVIQKCIQNMSVEISFWHLPCLLLSVTIVVMLDIAFIHYFKWKHCFIGCPNSTCPCVHVYVKIQCRNTDLHPLNHNLFIYLPSHWPD